METTVTVHLNPDDKTLHIRPRGEGANAVNDFTIFPAATDGLVKQNHYVQIRFAKPVDENSLRVDPYKYFSGAYVNGPWMYPLYNDGSGGPFNPSGNGGHLNVRFNNIRITGSNPGFGVSGYYLENFFYPPVLSADGTVLTLWTRLRRTAGTPSQPRNNPGYPFFASYVEQGTGYWSRDISINITLDGNIRDTSGLPLGTSRSLSYTMMGNGGYTFDSASVNPPPEYNASLPKDIFPNLNFWTIRAIFHEDTEGIIDPAKFFHTRTDGQAKVVPPLPGDTPGGHYNSRYIYVLFQASYTLWPVTGLRVFYSNPPASTYSSSSYHVDYPLYAQGTSSAAPADNERRDRLLSAYKEKMRDNQYFRGGFPVYVARVDLEEETASGTARYLFVPSIDGEPGYMPGSALQYWAGTTSPMGLYMNRAEGMSNNLAYGEYIDFTYE
jgi:hypothetical protein